MKEPYLEVTYRRGKALAAYYYLPRKGDETSARSKEAESGFIVDYSPEGQPIGIELVDPGNVTLDAMNRVLQGLGFPALSSDDLAPLQAA